MKKILFIFLIVISVFLSQSCSIGTKGKYFHSSLHSKYKEKSVKNIAIFVFSEGETDTMKIYQPQQTDNGITAYEPINVDGTDVGLDIENFPDEVDKNTIFLPSKSNENQSKELATNIKKELDSMGYNCKVISEFGHNREIKFSECMKYSKDNGYDGVFFCNYRSLKNWGIYTSHDTTATKNIYNYRIRTGYMFIPNSSLFEVNTGELLWKNVNYGLVEYAHLFNLSGLRYFQVANDPLYQYGQDDYQNAAKSVINLIFRPEYWPDSFVALPPYTPKK